MKILSCKIGENPCISTLNSCGGHPCFIQKYTHRLDYTNVRADLDLHCTQLTCRLYSYKRCAQRFLMSHIDANKTGKEVTPVNVDDCILCRSNGSFYLENDSCETI